MLKILLLALCCIIIGITGCSDILVIPDDDQKTTTSQQEAREIMGKNILGTEEVRDFLGFRPSAVTIPYSSQTLRKRKNSHVLVLVDRVSTKDVLDRLPFMVQTPEPELVDAALAQRPGETRWILIQKGLLNGSSGKTWQEQIVIVGDSNNVPTIQQLLYAATLYYMARGESLIVEGNFIRSISLDSTGQRIGLVYLPSEGFAILAGDDNASEIQTFPTGTTTHRRPDNP